MTDKYSLVPVLSFNLDSTWPNKERKTTMTRNMYMMYDEYLKCECSTLIPRCAVFFSIDVIAFSVDTNSDYVFEIIQEDKLVAQFPDSMRFLIEHLKLRWTFYNHGSVFSRNTGNHFDQKSHCVYTYAYTYMRMYDLQIFKFKMYGACQTWLRVSMQISIVYVNELMC